MDHEIATQMKAPERYVIGELDAAERESFEEHFAGCPSCMDEVTSISAFAANARAVFRERAAESARTAWVRPRSRFWNLRWQVAIPAFAAAALAFFAIYQNSVTIPGLRAPRAFMPAVVLDGATRAALPRVPADAPLRFQMAIASGTTASRIWAELTSDSGKALSAGWVNVPPSGEPLDVYFPIKVNPGRYTIVIRAGEAGGAELSRNRFEVAGQEPSTR